MSIIAFIKFSLTELRRRVSFEEVFPSKDIVSNFNCICLQSRDTIKEKQKQDGSLLLNVVVWKKALRQNFEFYDVATKFLEIKTEKSRMTTCLEHH